ncbi:MAG: guanylate kinase [Lachnospiraceae bacterium]|nr:guanylate kinase [Lachnospiraceae bacterium]
MIYVLMGKSATGKDTIFGLLRNSRPDFKTIVTYTTRPIRSNEENGKEYYFVNDMELDKLKSQDKIVELREYNTVHGLWRYFTVDDGQVDIKNGNYIIIGTLESFNGIRSYYGEGNVTPIYIEIDDGIRLERALLREKQQKNPKYMEMCRRFLADDEDFSEDKIVAAGIKKRYINNNIDECVEEILHDMV